MNKKCIRNPIENCLSSKNETICEKCKDGYIPYDNKCYKNPDKNCAAFNGQNCINCLNES